MPAFISGIVKMLIGEALKNKITGTTTMQEPAGKGLLLSKTTWGVSALTYLLVSQFNFTNPDAAEIAQMIATAGAALFALYGRYKATQKIG